MPHVLANGIDLYHEFGGEPEPAPRLLFIGGSGGDLRQKPNSLSGPLARAFQMLAFDQRGLGRSEQPECDYSMADYAEDAAALLTGVGWDRCHVVGVSFGGMVAQELAIRFPERIDRLVLCCTSSGGLGGASYPLHELQDLPEEQRARTGLGLSDTRYDSAWQAANPEAAEKLLAVMRERTGPREDGGAGERLARGMRRQLEARRQLDTWDRLPKVESQTLLCGGRYDGIAPPKNLEAIASRIPRAELEFFDGGHMFMVQDRMALPRIVDFLRS